MFIQPISIKLGMVDPIALLMIKTHQQGDSWWFISSIIFLISWSVEAHSIRELTQDDGEGIGDDGPPGVCTKICSSFSGWVMKMEMEAWFILIFCLQTCSIFHINLFYGVSIIPLKKIQGWKNRTCLKPPTSHVIRRVSWLITTPFFKKKHIAGRWSLGPKVPPRQNDPEAEANKIWLHK